jgi:uncharacterized protein (TIGR04255 family)
MSALPSFDDPPVVETVLGVEFASLSKWSVPYFGLFWNTIRDEYPRFEVRPPLDQQEERFGDEKKTLAFQGLSIELLNQPRVRCWFHETDERRMLQVQQDRFVHNWRKQGAPDVYPRYERIRSIFEREWQRFTQFVDDEGLGPISLTHCEVSYVNHLEQGREWQTLQDLHRVLTICGDFQRTHLPALEGVQMVASFAKDQENTRLRVTLQHAIRNRDLREILQLTLSARGRPTGASSNDILAWMDSARAWVVQAFADVTTTDMHRIWKRRV